MNTGKTFYRFLTGLDDHIPKLPKGVSVINPYKEHKVRTVCSKFCSTFYKSNKKRVLILGINPGRFGAGITGIPFTDPVSLEVNCGIDNSFEKRSELSSRFVYEWIEAFGGPECFYDSFLLSAVCPLGFLRGPKNYNYYDDPALKRLSMDLIKYSLSEHLKMNVHKDRVIVLGKKNAMLVGELALEFGCFSTIEILDHPRYVMQYRLRSKQAYLKQFVRVSNGLL